MTVANLIRFTCDRGGKVWEGTLPTDSLLPPGWSTVSVVLEGVAEPYAYHLCDLCTPQHSQWLSTPADPNPDDPPA